MGVPARTARAAAAASTLLAGTGLALTLPILTTGTTERFGIGRDARHAARVRDRSHPVRRCRLTSP
jgi:hypothetical protein